MKNTMRTRLLGIGCTALILALPILAQEHKWAGRTLNDLEWRIHEELAMVPFHGVFDTLRFELHDKTVTLSGQVVRETVKTSAERVIKRLDGVDQVAVRRNPVVRKGGPGCGGRVKQGRFLGRVIAFPHGCREHDGIERISTANARALVIRENKGAVLAGGASGGGAELVLPQLSHAERKKIARVEQVVAHELVYLPVDLIGAGFQLNRNGGASLTVLRGHGVRLHPELLDGVRRRRDDYAVKTLVCRADAVDGEQRL